MLLGPPPLNCLFLHLLSTFLLVMASLKGTFYYMACEVSKQHAKTQGTDIPFDPQVYHQSADIVAVGLTFCFMITGNVPFEGTNKEKNDEKVPCLPDYFPNDFVQIVLKMIHPKSAQRPIAKKARHALKMFEKDNEQMTHFEIACGQFRQIEKRNKYEYKSIDEALKKIKTELGTLKCDIYKYKGQLKFSLNLDVAPKKHGYGVQTWNASGRTYSGFFLKDPPI